MLPQNLIPGLVIAYASVGFSAAIPADVEESEECLAEGIIAYPGEAISYNSPNRNVSCKTATIYSLTDNQPYDVEITGDNGRCPGQPHEAITIPSDLSGAVKITWNCEGRQANPCRIFTIGDAVEHAETASKVSSFVISQTCRTSGTPPSFCKPSPTTKKVPTTIDATTAPATTVTGSDSVPNPTYTVADSSSPTILPTTQPHNPAADTKAPASTNVNNMPMSTLPTPTAAEEGPTPTEAEEGPTPTEAEEGPSVAATEQPSNHITDTVAAVSTTVGPICTCTCSAAAAAA